MAGLTTRTQSGTEQAVAAPLVETQNPNDAEGRNPGDPTVSLNSDGTVANTSVNPVSVTVPVDPAPHPQSDPAHVPSPFQPPEVLEEQARSAKLREEALQAENRFRPDAPSGPFSPERRPPLHEVPEQPIYEEPRLEEPKHENHRKHGKRD